MYDNSYLQPETSNDHISKLAPTTVCSENHQKKGTSDFFFFF